MTLFEAPETPEELKVIMRAAQSMAVNDTVGMKGMYARWQNDCPPTEEELDALQRFVCANLG